MIRTIALVLAAAMLVTVPMAAAAMPSTDSPSQHQLIRRAFVGLPSVAASTALSGHGGTRYTSERQRQLRRDRLAREERERERRQVKKEAAAVKKAEKKAAREAAKQEGGKTKKGRFSKWL
jgi:hypothetical protein